MATTLEDMASDRIENGKFVSLTYSITDEKGNVLEQSDLPVSYVYGGDTELVGGVDKAILGKQEGDKVEVTVPPENAFGDHDPGLTFTDKIANVPPEFRRLGAEVEMRNESGEPRTFYVTRIEGDELTVDGNHPLAGKTITVHVRILEVRDALPDDARNSGINSVNQPTLH
jgi:FKBP-type peptidyl-prolyl cis-trans isomerase SlyD